MPINLDKLTSKKILQRPVHPLEIWNQLDRAVGKEYLRPIQEKVLTAWFAQRGDPNIVIKMSTGTGKTLVGLMILQSSLHEGHGPAIYLCPDIYLSKQVVSEAKLFGVPCVSFDDDPREIPSSFLNSESILVTNVWKFFNGKTIFGVPGGPRSVVRVGTILFDDAHACIEQIRSQFTILLDSKHKAYQKLLSLFGPTLNRQKAGTYAEILENDYSKFMAVPYWSWADSQDEVVRILTEHRDDDGVKFSWPLLKDILPLCDCIVSGTKLQIAARVPQPHLIPSFESAKRKVFLSATLLDDSQMARDLGVPPDDIAKQIYPNEFDDLGERLILIPAEIDRELGTDFAIGVSAASKKANRIVLVPTTRDSERWVAAGATAVAAENMESALEPLRTSIGSFLVLISKYDGIDLPDSACRLLVLDGLPRGATLADWYMQSVLDGTPTVDAKIAQRIEQGLGRGTRGKSDYCVVLISGNDLVSFVRNKTNRGHLSAGTNVQLELGLAITREIRDSSDSAKYGSDLVVEINRCLKREEEWKGFYRSFVDGARDQFPRVPKSADRLEIARVEHQLAAAFLRKDHLGVEKHIKELIERELLSDRERGWFMQVGGTYLYPRDKSRSMSMQKRAYELNSHLFVPPEGIQYHRMARVTDSQALRALKHLKSFDNQNDYILELNSVCDRLAFGVEAELFEQALEDVAKIIGIASSRPEKNIGKGPDCLWLNDSEKFLIIEAKSQVDLGRREIYKSESEQLIHSCEWFKQEYERKSGRPVMFHPAISLAREAVFPVEGRVVTPDALRKFVSGVRAFGTGVIANGLQGITERQIREQLELNRLQFDQCFGGGTKVE